MKYVWIAALLGACSGSSKPSETPPANHAGDPVAESGERACETDADCEVVELDCCDHCNGGRADAFNHAHAKSHAMTASCDVACTQMACGEAVAKCEAHLCVSTIAPLQ